MASQVSRSRMLDLIKVQCKLFSTIYNPTGIRMGNKVLRQRLRGPVLANYYPRRTATLEDLKMAFKKHDFEALNPDEDDRVEAIAIRKLRGKGPPKKKREKEVVKGRKKK